MEDLPSPAEREELAVPPPDAEAARAASAPSAPRPPVDAAALRGKAAAAVESLAAAAAKAVAAKAKAAESAAKSTVKLSVRQPGVDTVLAAFDGASSWTGADVEAALSVALPADVSIAGIFVGAAVWPEGKTLEQLGLVFSVEVDVQAALFVQEDHEVYVKEVANKVQQATHTRQEVAAWLLTESAARGSPKTERFEAYVDSIFEAAGPRSYLEGRSRQLAIASQRQHYLLQERKNRKRERMMQAAGKTLADKLSPTAPGNALVNMMSEVIAAAATQRGPDDTTSTGRRDERSKQVGSFDTHEDALRFVMRCQPFDFTPVTKGDTEPFPRFDNSADAHAHALKLQPLPMEFVNSSIEVCRRLRIVMTELEEVAASGTRPGKLRRNTNAPRLGAAAADVERVEPSKPRKVQYIVEALGGFFERPQSLRDLREVGTRYFIAVAPDILHRVLTEGFRVKRRTSIVCSATPQDAIEYYRSREASIDQQQSESVGVVREKVAAVIVVNLAPHLDVVAHRSVPGAFRIKAKELPPGCLKERKG